MIGQVRVGLEGKAGGTAVPERRTAGLSRFEGQPDLGLIPLPENAKGGA